MQNLAIFTLLAMATTLSFGLYAQEKKILPGYDSYENTCNCIIEVEKESGAGHAIYISYDPNAGGSSVPLNVNVIDQISKNREFSTAEKRVAYFRDKEKFDLSKKEAEAYARKSHKNFTYKVPNTRTRINLRGGEYMIYSMNKEELFIGDQQELLNADGENYNSSIGLSLETTNDLKKLDFSDGCTKSCPFPVDIAQSEVSQKNRFKISQEDIQACTDAVKEKYPVCAMKPVCKQPLKAENLIFNIKDANGLVTPYLVSNKVPITNNNRNPTIKYDKSAITYDVSVAEFNALFIGAGVGNDYFGNLKKHDDCEAQKKAGIREENSPCPGAGSFQSPTVRKNIVAKYKAAKKNDCKVFKNVAKANPYLDYKVENTMKKVCIVDDGGKRYLFDVASYCKKKTPCLRVENMKFSQAAGEFTVKTVEGVDRPSFLCDQKGTGYQFHGVLGGQFPPEDLYVQFENDKHNFIPGEIKGDEKQFEIYNKQIEQIVQYLAYNPGVKINVSGFASISGNETEKGRQHNIDLSKDRAGSIADEIMVQYQKLTGKDPKDIIASRIGYGASKADQTIDRAEDRKIEIEYIAP